MDTDLVEVIPDRLHMFRFPIGQAYLWQDGEALTRATGCCPPGTASPPSAR
ncbi:hypothetical protein [Streptomyces sp. NPDC002044]|uniref:hypothetical protein n=1 Tax=Streptomyces sp. NPDC002044 TaxID=3154662 RepID=UPI0033170CBA